MKIKQITQISLCILVTLVLSSCKKISDRKLNGEWTATTGTISEESIDDSGADIKSIVFDGSNNTQTRTYLGNTTTEVSAYSEKLTFDKKKGTFTKVITEAKTNLNDITDYSTIYDANGTSLGLASIVRTTSNSTSTITGIYSITGGSGDIKKNSEIVLHYKSMTTVTNGTQIAKLNNLNSYVTITDDVYDEKGVKISKNYSLTETYSGNFEFGVDNFDLPSIIKVTDLTNTKMEIEYSTIVNYTTSSSSKGDSKGSFNRKTKMNYKQ